MTRARARSKSGARSTTRGVVRRARGDPRPRRRRPARSAAGRRPARRTGRRTARGSRRTPSVSCPPGTPSAPAQVLLVDDHVAERADRVRPHPGPQRLGDRLPLRDQRGDVAVAAGLHLLPVHAALWSSGSSPATTSAPSPTMCESRSRTVQSGQAGTRSSARSGGRSGNQVDHPLLSSAPLLDGVHAHTQPPRARRRSALGVSGRRVGVRTSRRVSRRACCGECACTVAGLRSATSPGSPRDRGRRPGAVGLRAGQGSGLHPRGARAERVDGARPGPGRRA